MTNAFTDNDLKVRPLRRTHRRMNHDGDHRARARAAGQLAYPDHQRTLRARRGQGPRRARSAAYPHDGGPSGTRVTPAGSGMSRSNRLHGRAASHVVVLPRAVRDRARMGPRLIIVSWSTCDCPPALAAGTPGPSGASSGVPPDKGLPLGVVPAAPRHWRPGLTAFAALDG